MKAAKQGRAKPAARRDGKGELVSLLRRMWVIRAFEEKVSALYAAREIVGLLHLGIGQEAVAVGSAACSTPMTRCSGGTVPMGTPSPRGRT